MGDLSASDVYEDSLRRRLEKTCDWIFDRPQYLEWVSAEFEGNRPKLLWIYGPTGFGKTVLCSQITKHVSSLPESQSTLTAHFFLSADLGSREDPFVIIRSWISQMIASEDHAFRLSMDEKQSQQSKTASHTSILNVLSKIVQALPRCTLIVDGLDECMSSVVEFLSSLRRAIAGSSTRLLIVSRDEGDIREGLSVNNAGQIAFSEYEVTSAYTEADIAMYSRSIVEDKLSNKTSAVRDDISGKMAQRCEGQFLWLRLQGDGLRRGMNRKQLQNTVNETPVSLDRVYSKNWEKIMALPGGARDRAIALLRWATFAVRPLTVREMTEAVLIGLQNDADGLPIDPGELPDAFDQDYIDTEITGLCFSLLEVRLSISESDSSKGSRTIHLTHFSVKEFLLPNLVAAADVPRGLPLPGTSATVKEGENSTHALLTRLCLHYIEFPQIWQQTSPTEASAESDEAAGSRPGGFQDYAAMSWPRHRALSSNTREDPDYAASLFDRAHPVWDLWTDWQDRKQGLGPEWLKEEKDAQAPGPLYYAALVGFPRLVQYLLEHGEDATEASAKGRSAIAAASAGGFPEIVKILLDAGSEVTVPNVFGNAPIHGAVYRGNVETVRLLLDHGADLTVENDEGITPLMMACKSGFTDIAKPLLEAGVDPHHRNKSGANATHYAAGFGQAEALKLLLERGVDIHFFQAEGHQPIHLACQYGHEQVVKLLISHGAPVDSPMEDAWSPLHWASTNGHAEVVKLLLSAGANVDAMLLSTYYTPLIMACTSGHLEVVKILMEAGADMYVETMLDGWTPLTVAVNNGCIEVVEYLLGLGADANYTPQGSLSWHPLHLAASKGNKEMLRLLLDHGGDLTLRNRYSEVPYHVAIFCKQVEMAELLIDMGMDVDYSGKDGQTPLHWAGEEDRIDMVEFLIQKGANIEARDARGQTPLHTASLVGKSAYADLLIRKGAKLEPVDEDKHMPIHLAAMQGHANVVRLLIDHGASPNGHPGPSHTPLSYSALAGHADVMALLLDGGAEIDHVDNGGNTPLHLAAYGEKLQAAGILLDRGANIDHKNSSGWTPLHQAISESHLKAAKLLIQRGADLQCVDNNGLKPLEFAFGQGHKCKQDLALPWPRDLDSNKATPSILGIITHSRSDKLQKDCYLIHYAAAAGAVDVIEILLRKGENIDTESRALGLTPLTVALAYRRPETVKWLVERGANVNGPPSMREICPLVLAAGYGLAATTRLLLEKGADLEARAAMSRTPFHLACEGGHLSVVKVFCQYSRENPEASAAGPPGADGVGRSGLFKAALWGHDPVVEYLCSDDRVNITEQDWAGNSALLTAVANGHVKVVQTLLSHCSTWVAPRSEAAALLWKRARGTKQHAIMRLVAAYLREQNPTFRKESKGDVDAAPKQIRAGVFCDACTLYIPEGEEYRHCDKCLGGYFCMCAPCFESGRRCLDRAHGQMAAYDKKDKEKKDEEKREREMKEQREKLEREKKKKKNVEKQEKKRKKEKKGTKTPSVP
jgi:ankyrin repeat protein